MKKKTFIFFMLCIALLAACGKEKNTTKNSNTQQSSLEQKNIASKVALDISKKMKSSGNIKIEIYQAESDGFHKKMTSGTIAITKKNPKIGIEISNLDNSSATMTYLDGWPLWKNAKKGVSFKQESNFSSLEGDFSEVKSSANQFYSEGDHTLQVVQYEAAEGDYSLPSNQSKIIDCQTLNYTITYPKEK